MILLTIIIVCSIIIPYFLYMGFNMQSFSPGRMSAGVSPTGGRYLEDGPVVPGKTFGVSERQAAYYDLDE